MLQEWDRLLLILQTTFWRVRLGQTACNPTPDSYKRQLASTPPSLPLKGSGSQDQLFLSVGKDSLESLEVLNCAGFVLEAACRSLQLQRICFQDVEHKPDSRDRLSVRSYEKGSAY